MIKKKIIRLLKRLPYIKGYEKELADARRMLRNTDKQMAVLYKDKRDFREQAESLEKEIQRLRESAKEVEAKKNDHACLKIDLEQMKQSEQRYKADIENLNNNLSRLWDERKNLEQEKELLSSKNKGLEAKLEKAREGFALFDKFKQYAIKEFTELKKEHDELKLKYAESVGTLKQRVVDLINVARTYKFEANDFAMDMLTSTLEGAGISAIVFDEEKIEYVTSYVSEKLGIPESRLVGKEFADVFEQESLEAFCEFGPQHPLKVKEPQRDFAGILFSFTMGHDPKTKSLKQYRAIWLVDDRKIGMSSYFRRNAVAMPRQITAAAAKNAVGSFLNASIGTFGKKKSLVLECNASNVIDKEAAEYLARVASSEMCSLYVRHPSAFLYKALMSAGFPEDNIKAYSPEKESRIKTVFFGLGFNPA